MCAPSLSQPLTQPLVPPGHPAQPPLLAPYTLYFALPVSLWIFVGGAGGEEEGPKAVSHSAASINVQRTPLIYTH